MSRVDLRRRIKALNQAVNPAGSFNARLADLSDEQRAAYGRWRDNLALWHGGPGNVYKRMLEGDEPPPLRSDVHKALYGTALSTTADMTVPQSAEQYTRLLKGD